MEFLQGSRLRGSVTKSWGAGNQIVREGRFAAAGGKWFCCFPGHSVQSAAMLSSSSSTPASAVTQQRATGFWLPRDITAAERRTLLAGGLGWMLDAMDVMLFSLVIAYLLREFSMDTRTAGFLDSRTLIASAIGGFLFGFLADRIGRTRALMASILVYSISSAACAFTHTVPQLAFLD